MVIEVNISSSSRREILPNKFVTAGRISLAENISGKRVSSHFLDRALLSLFWSLVQMPRQMRCLTARGRVLL